MALTSSVVSLVANASATIGQQVLGAQFQTDLVEACSAPETAESDSGVIAGGKVVRPDSIARAEQNRLHVGGMVKTVSLVLKYDDGLTGITDPVVRVFGRDTNGLFWPCKDVSGGTEITLATSATLDVHDGTFKYTEPRDVDVSGANEVIVAVQTALDGTGTKNNSAILVRAKDRITEAN